MKKLIIYASGNSSKVNTDFGSAKSGFRFSVSCTDGSIPSSDFFTEVKMMEDGLILNARAAFDKSTASGCLRDIMAASSAVNGYEPAKSTLAHISATAAERANTDEAARAAEAATCLARRKTGALREIVNGIAMMAERKIRKGASLADLFAYLAEYKTGYTLNGKPVTVTEFDGSKFVQNDSFCQQVLTGRTCSYRFSPDGQTVAAEIEASREFVKRIVVAVVETADAVASATAAKAELSEAVKAEEFAVMAYFRRERALAASLRSASAVLRHNENSLNTAMGSERAAAAALEAANGEEAKAAAAAALEAAKRRTSEEKDAVVTAKSNRDAAAAALEAFRRHD